MAVSPPEGRGGGAPEEEVVVGASCRVVASTMASRAVLEAYSSSRRKVMEWMQA
jgi:hypothetical protein